MTAIATDTRLKAAAHELSHCAGALAFGLDVPQVEIYHRHDRYASETTVERAVVLAQDASPEIRRAAHGVDAIVAACGVIADALLGLDGAAAANDRQRAWDHLHAIHATREEAFCALDEARRIVRAAWPKILRAAPVLARLGALDGAQVRQLLR